MSSPELVPGFTTFYRFEDRRDLFDADKHLITMRRLLLDRISATGKTAWLRPASHGGGSLKRISLTSRKPWAAPDVQEAWRLFLDRKRWQLSFIEDQRRRAQALLEVAPALDPLDIALLPSGLPAPSASVRVDLDPLPSFFSLHAP